MGKIEKLQKLIDETNYWDRKALGFQIDYFGDEVALQYFKDEKNCWEIMFLTCYLVHYKTDATWREIAHVKDMVKMQKGYYCQKIQISPSKAGNGFIDVIMDLSIMDVQITCKEIEINQKHL